MISCGTENFMIQKKHSLQSLMTIVSYLASIRDLKLINLATHYKLLLPLTVTLLFPPFVKSPLILSPVKTSITLSFVSFS